MVDITRKAANEGRAPEPRLMFTNTELREVRKFQAIARAEQAELGAEREGGQP